MSRDLKLLVASNALRNFGYGMMEVLFVLYLTDIGFDAIRVGAFITTTLIGSALLNLTVGVFADRLGRRSLMALATMIMILAGLVIMFSKNFIVIF